MATNYDTLKTLLQTEAAKITDDIGEVKALILIDQYIAALTQQAASSATDITSYSIGGRSVTRSGGKNYGSLVSELEKQLNELLYGNVTYIDFRSLSTTLDPADGT